MPRRPEPRWDLQSLHAHAAAMHGLVPHRPGGACPGCPAGHTSTESVNCLSLIRLAELVGVSSRSLLRWSHRGLSTLWADRTAVALGTHPACIWPTWTREEAAA